MEIPDEIAVSARYTSSIYYAIRPVYIIRWEMVRGCGQTGSF